MELGFCQVQYLKIAADALIWSYKCPGNSGSQPVLCSGHPDPKRNEQQWGQQPAQHISHSQITFAFFIAPLQQNSGGSVGCIRLDWWSGEFNCRGPKQRTISDWYELILICKFSDFLLSHYLRNSGEILNLLASVAKLINFKRTEWMFISKTDPHSYQVSYSRLYFQDDEN